MRTLEGRLELTEVNTPVGVGYETRALEFNVQNSSHSSFNKTTQDPINAVGKGGLPPLKNHLTSTLNQRHLERGQATLPNCIYLTLNYFTEA